LSCRDSEDWTPRGLAIFTGAVTVAALLSTPADECDREALQQWQPLRGICDSCTRVSLELVYLCRSCLGFAC
jgi:hypothetical protein